MGVNFTGRREKYALKAIYKKLSSLQRNMKRTVIFLYGIFLCTG